MRRRRRTKEREEQREDWRLILKNLHAVLLRSFRRQHGEKKVCSRGVPGVSGTFGKTNSHFDPNQTGSETAPPR